MQVTIKLDGVNNIYKVFNRKRTKIIEAAQRAEEEVSQSILQSAKSKIQSISGETAASLDARLVHKSKTAVVSKIGTLDGTKEECVRANSLEYGHAAPGEGKDSGVKNPVKTVPAHPFVRPAIKEHKAKFKRKMKEAIQKAIEGD
jgi:hypothetical protein